jgi:HTH-type transcriptional regulator / antitoxin HipB
VAKQRRSRADMRARAEQRGVLAAGVFARREVLGLRQEELADLAGCSPRFVHDLEAGKPTVQLDKVLSVLDVLGLGLAIVDGTTGITIADDSAHLLGNDG